MVLKKDNENAITKSYITETLLFLKYTSFLGYLVIRFYKHKEKKSHVILPAHGTNSIKIMHVIHPALPGALCR